MRKGKESLCCYACFFFWQGKGHFWPGWGRGPKVADGSDDSLGSLRSPCPNLKPPAWPPALPLNTEPSHAFGIFQVEIRLKGPLAPRTQYVFSLVPPPLTPSSPLGSGTKAPLEPWALLPAGGGGERWQPRKETGPPGDPHVPLPTPHQFQTHLRFIFLCCLLCGGQASQPTQSWTGQPWPETAVPAKPRAAPRLQSSPPLSQAGPGRTLFMEPQGLSPLLSAHVYSLTVFAS